MKLSQLVEPVRSSVIRDSMTSYDDMSTQMLRSLRNKADGSHALAVALAGNLCRRYTAIEDIGPNDPLVAALIRTCNHPNFRPLSGPLPLGGRGGPDLLPAIQKLRVSKPLEWSSKAVGKLLVDDLRRTFPNHCIDLNRAPWENYWGEARDTAYALFDLTAFVKADRI